MFRKIRKMVFSSPDE